MYLCNQVRILGSPFILSLMYDRYTKPPSWRNLAKRPTPQRGSRDAAECADAGCTGATGTRGYGGCAGAAVLGCGRSVPLKTAVESSPWTERGAPKSALTHQKQTPFFSSSGKSKSTNAPWRGDRLEKETFDPVQPTRAGLFMTRAARTPDSHHCGLSLPSLRFESYMYMCMCTF